jgi:hypothetical protein
LSPSPAAGILKGEKEKKIQVVENFVENFVATAVLQKLTKTNGPCF